MPIRKKAKKSTSRSVDFSGVESGGGAVHIPEGEYRVKCEEAEWTESKEGNEMIAWIFKGLEGKAKGKKFYFYTTVTDNSVWKLKETLEGLEVEVPDGALDVDTDELVGLEGVGVIEDDEYQGKTRSKLARIVSAGGEEEEGEEEEEDETPAAKKSAANGKSKGKKKTLISAEQVKEMDEDDLEGCVTDNGLEIDLGDYKVLSKKRAAVIAALEENDLLEA